MTLISAPPASSARTHELKCDPVSFRAVMRGGKKFEVRKNDRGFKVGDILVLHETKYSASEMSRSGLPLVYTGNQVPGVVTYILEPPAPGLVPPWIIMSVDFILPP